MSTSPFPLPILFTAWKFRDGAGIAGEVIRQAKLMGARSVAVQLREDTLDNTTDGGSTLDRFDVKAMQDAGLFVIGWDVCGAHTAELLADLGVDGWMPQVEGPGERDALLAALKAGVGKGGMMPMALVTTYGGLDTQADVNALRALWHDPVVFVECYKADGAPHEQIDRMLGQGVVYGFDRAWLFAIVGTYRGEMPGDYPGLDAADYGGVYLVEQTTDAQLKAFAAIPTSVVPAPAPQPIPDPAVVNRQIAALADTWLVPHEGDETLTRLRAIRDIAMTADGTWLARRKDVRAAIDGKLDTTTAELLQKQLDAAQADIKVLNDKLTEQKRALDSELAARVEAQSVLNMALAKIAAAQRELA